MGATREKCGEVSSWSLVLKHETRVFLFSSLRVLQLLVFVLSERLFGS